MPLKEFECQGCHHRFEELLMLNEPNPAKCPKCGSPELKQLLGTFRIIGLRSKSARARGDEDGESPADGSFEDAEFDEEGRDSGMDDDGGGGGFPAGDDSGASGPGGPPEADGGGDLTDGEGE